MDDSPRPQKRQRTDPSRYYKAELPAIQSIHRPYPSPSHQHQHQRQHLAEAQPPTLPSLPVHPPTHEGYALSLFSSLQALRRCLDQHALMPDVEARAWTALAEVGMRVVESGFSASAEHAWAVGVEQEVEKALAKGLVITQKHPSLRPLRIQLSLLNAHFAFQNNNTKFARALLRRLVASFTSSDPPPLVYAAHLALITQLTSSPPPPSTAPAHPPSSEPSSSTTSSEPAPSAPGPAAENKPTSTSTSAPELQAALTCISTLSTLGAQNRHPAIQDLAAVLRLRVLVSAGVWDLVGEALQGAEKALCLVFDDGGEGGASDQQQQQQQADNKVKQETAEGLMRSYSISAQEVHDSASSQSQSQSQHDLVSEHHDDSPPAFASASASATKTAAHLPSPSPPQRLKQSDPLTLSLTAHTLIMGIVYHTHAGRARSAEPRLVALHALMDSGALVGGDKSDGTVEIPLPGHASLPLRTTHPRVLFLLTFLVSAVAKRDPVGRRPKKKVFAENGIAQCREGREGGGGGESVNYPIWATLADVKEVDQRTLRIEADLLCELVAVSIQRSDFDAAESHLDVLIAHTRTHDFFADYAPRITLHYAHLAHALGDTDRATTCYRVAAHLDGAGPVGSQGGRVGGFVAAAARAGEALLHIGLAASRPPAGGPSSPPSTPTRIGTLTPPPPPRTTAGAVAAAAADDDETDASHLDGPTLALAKDAIARCTAHASSAPFPALTALLSAALCPSHILRSKSLLKHALALSGAAGDNHLRALVLAVVGAQYVYTAPAHAMEVLAVCETLGAGMGASVRRGGEGGQGGPQGGQEESAVVGHARLRLWVGERFLELFRRAGKESRVKKQEAFNAVYRAAVEKLEEWRSRLW
ncbi:hypothetical protein F5I97DRAFT_1969951 [Phlebopus sp. FC_14]|nr:hypothetical protein F5I97DRAFT_1969951 [Phlebopus sp. FC_14]